MEQYLIVLNKKNVDHNAFWQDLETPTEGIYYIPDREVKWEKNEFQHKNYQKVYLLTLEEKELLEQDPRVRGIDNYPLPEPQLLINQEGIFNRKFSEELKNTRLNWGLINHSQRTPSPQFMDEYGIGYPNPPEEDNKQTVYDTYKYFNEGEGVDLIISDTSILKSHPEFLDSEGNTRFDNLDSNSASHGTWVASISAGKTLGFAKKSNLYYEYLGSSGLQNILDFHENKPLNPLTGKRKPTVVNMSWGNWSTIYKYDSDNIISEIYYRGTIYTGDDIGDPSFNKRTYGINFQYSSGEKIIRVPRTSTSTDSLLEDLIEAGVLCCVAAGNGGQKTCSPGDPDYDNYFRINNGLYKYYYNRTLSPYSIEKADSFFKVGAIQDFTKILTEGTSIEDPSSYIDCAANFSEKGPAVNIWAAGTAVPGANYQYNSSDPNSYYSGRKGSGTSYASPQVAGVACLVMSKYPSFTPKQCVDFIISNCLTRISGSESRQDEIDNPDWSDDNNLLGSKKRVLFLQQRENIKITGNLKLKNLNLKN